MLKQIVVGSIFVSVFLSSAQAEQTFSQATPISKGKVSVGTIQHATITSADVTPEFKTNSLLSGGTITSGSIESGSITGGSIDDADITSDKTTRITTIKKIKNATLVGNKLTGVKASGIINKDTHNVNSAEVSGIDLAAFELENVDLINVEIPIDFVVTDTNLKKSNLSPKASDFFTPGAWGAGLGLLWNEQPVVSNASIVNNTVRADTIQQSQPELVLTRHYYNADGNTCKGAGEFSRGLFNVFDKNSCIGGFVAVGISSSSQLIDMFGVGVLFGFGKVFEKGTDGKLSENAQLRQHNFGIGIGRRFGVKQLGDGFTNNVAPPTGEPQVRYKTVDIPVWFLMYSYTLSGL
jgi:hypothetical protein